MAGMALVLAGSGVTSPVAAAEQGLSAEQGQTATPAHPAAHHARHGSLEERVALLTRALELDARQQVALRKVLLGQREQLQRIWRDGSVPSGDRIASTKAVSMRTAEQIRSLLNEEQRKKYEPPPQRDPGQAVGGAHVEDWMKGASGSGEAGRTSTHERL
jgi:hypothetical protein